MGCKTKKKGKIPMPTKKMKTELAITDMRIY